MSRGTYEPLPRTVRNDEENIATPQESSTAAAGSFNMTVLPSPRSRASTTSSVGGATHTKPRRSSPLTRTLSTGTDGRIGFFADDPRQNRRDPSAERSSTGAILDLPPPRHPSRSRRLIHNFDSEKQFWRLFSRGLVRFLGTFTLVVVFVTTIWLFSKKQVMSSKWKKWFNAISTGLSLALGISLAHSFKCMAVDLRWWILSRRTRSLSEVDKILHLDSLSILLKLLGSSFKRPFVHKSARWDFGLIAACFLFLFVNIGVQVAVAMVGLNYNIDVNDRVARTKPGMVLLPDMQQIHPVGLGIVSQDSIGAQQYSANSFGNEALGFQTDWRSNIPKPGSFWSTGADFFQADDQESWLFVFLESPRTGIVVASSIYTNRSVNSTWRCESWPVILGGNGTVANLTVQKNSNGETFNVSLPVIGGPNQTTYLTAPDTTCGLGCSIIEAFEASFSNPWYYSCNVTVGSVQNGYLPEHEVGLAFRQMASAGIALQGYGLTSSIPGVKQSQVYPSQSPYGAPQEGDPDGMGSLIAAFAIGVVSVAALRPNNHTFLVPGQEPKLGNQLVVQEWRFIWLIMGLILGAQGVGFVLTAFWANRVLVKDESPLGIARLLRPIVDELGNHGSAARGRKICEEIGEELEVRYTVHQREPKGPFQLELNSHGRIRAFPEGEYD